MKVVRTLDANTIEVETLDGDGLACIPTGLAHILASAVGYYLTGITAVGHITVSALLSLFTASEEGKADDHHCKK